MCIALLKQCYEWTGHKDKHTDNAVSLESLSQLEILFHNSFSKLIFELKLSLEVICHWHKKSSANVTACLYWQRKLSELGQKLLKSYKQLDILYYLVFQKQNIPSTGQTIGLKNVMNGREDPALYLNHSSSTECPIKRITVGMI